MSDSYPEYLNPFAEDLKPKPKLRIRNSFKELKRSLRQSFRIKKKDEEEVTIRQKPPAPRRPPVSYPTYQGEALPRSRFHERISRLREESPGPNPFEEEGSNGEIKSTMRRKGKKRAPLPPKSLSSQHLNDENLEIPAGGSHWSLTSVETDYSGSTDNRGPEEPESDSKRESLAEEFVDFNKNMDQLKDDSNNNVITKEEAIESNNNIPDLVVSCPKEIDSAKLQTNEDISEYRHKLDEEDNKSNVSEGDNTDLVVTDITNNMIADEHSDKKNETDVQNSADEPYLYHQKTSLYIAGSKDALNDDSYTGSVSLYITGSCDDLDASNNNEVCNKNVTDENSNDDAGPTPKQRKNKLTKNILLGM